MQENNIDGSIFSQIPTKKFAEEIIKYCKNNKKARGPSVKLWHGLNRLWESQAQVDDMVMNSWKHRDEISQSIHILETNPIANFNSDGTCDEIEEQFNQNVSWFNGNGKELGQSKVELIKDYSYNVVDQFEDNSFDFIYIDGAHDYESVKKDIELYAPKLKTFGILAGHDYEHTWPGVIKAVDEIVISPPQLMITDDSSWMIKKINTSFQ